jgi:hypothetical protein
MNSLGKLSTSTVGFYTISKRIKRGKREKKAKVWNEKESNGTE